LRIAYTGYDDLGGPGIIHAYHFACEMVERGHQVLFLIPGKMESIGLMGRSPPFRIEKLFFDGPFLEPRLAGEITAFHPDIVHAWTARNIPARTALEIKARTGARIIVHHEDDEDVLYRHEFPSRRLLRLRYFFKTLFLSKVGEPFPNLWNWKQPLISWCAGRAARCFTALSPALCRRLASKWRKKIFLIYPGVDLERFRPGVPPAPLRERFGLAGRRIIMYPGVVKPYHDFDILLKAMRRLVETDREVCLLQVGRLIDTDEMIASLIRDLDLGGRVILGGRVGHGEIPGCLAVADILVHPSRDNDFNRYRLPSKIPEYLAMGKPAVISHVGIGAEFRDRIEVLKTYTDDPGELADRLRELLRDGALRSALGLNARACAERMFDLKRNADELERVYRAALE